MVARRRSRRHKKVVLEELHRIDRMGLPVRLLLASNSATELAKASFSQELHKRDCIDSLGAVAHRAACTAAGHREPVKQAGTVGGRKIADSSVDMAVAGRAVGQVPTAWVQDDCTAAVPMEGEVEGDYTMHRLSVMGPGMLLRMAAH